MRYLIDNNIRYENGNKGFTFLEDGENRSVEALDSTEKVALELTYQSLTVVNYRLLEVEILPDNREVVRQEYCLAPDIAYSLFLFFSELEKND